MTAKEAAEKVLKKFETATVLEFRDEQTVTVKPGDFRAVMEFCKDDLNLEFLLDASSVDNTGDDPRFALVYELATLDDSIHLRVKTNIAEGEEIPTVSDLWATADWHEREIWDMMGIKFSGHPDLRRILMWEGYPYHPLRKEFPLAGKPSEMPDVAFTGEAPLEGGPFVTSAGAGSRVEAEPRAK
ncbi:MAG: NADH-quinone oxidoreductase subunit C [Akkermansiaceae bacterium]